MRGWILFAAALLAAGGLRADTVIMKETGLKLDGKVLRETDEFIVLLMHNDVGQVRILKSKIKSIEYDIKTQLEKIAEDDWLGRYKVGKWAFEKGLFPEAISLFESLEGKENVPAERLKLLGRAYEQRQQLDKALEKYADYLKAHPEDKEISERAATLAKEVNPAGAAATDPAAGGKQKIVDGLEGDGAWVGENWGNAAKVQIITDNFVGKSVSVTSEGGDKDKAALTRTGQPLNLSESKEMIFRVWFKSQAPGSLGVAFINSQNEFFEARPARLVPNTWNSVSIKVDGKDFKAEKSKWEHRLPLEGKERMSRIVFLIYGQRAFEMNIDSVFFK